MADSTRSASGFSQSSGFSQGTSMPAGTGTAAGDRKTDAAAAESAGEVVSEAKKVGTELVGAVRDSAVSLLDAQRDRAADQIAAVGEALKRSAQSLDAKNAAVIVDYADRAAAQISGFADTMRNRTWSDLAADVEDFARRWPMAFMASAIGIGFVAGRFLLSSAEAARETGRNSASRMTGPGQTQNLGQTAPSREHGSPAATSSHPGTGG